MFDFFKKKKQLELIIGSPVKGKAVPLSSVNDPTFSEGMLGQGICPEDSKIYAPADGTIGMVFNTLHAVSLTTKEGVEILIHIGLDTVKMNGEGFKGYVKAGDTVKKGDLLLEIDPNDYQVKLDQAEAKLAEAKARLNVSNHDVSKNTSDMHQASDDRVSAMSKLDFAQKDYSIQTRI